MRREYIHAQIHERMHKYMYKCMPYIHTCTRTFIHAYINACTHTYIHAYITYIVITYIHTDRQTDIYSKARTSMCCLSCGFRDACRGLGVTTRSRRLQLKVAVQTCPAQDFSLVASLNVAATLGWSVTTDRLHVCGKAWDSNIQYLRAYCQYFSTPCSSHRRGQSHGWNVMEWKLWNLSLNHGITFMNAVVCCLDHLNLLQCNESINCTSYGKFSIQHNKHRSNYIRYNYFF